MITDVILYTLASLVNLLLFPLRNLPDATLPDWLANSLSASASYINALGYVLPIGTIVAILSFYIVFEGVVWSYKIIRWAYNKIPGVN